LVSLGDKPSLVLNVAPGLKNGYLPNLNTLKWDFAAGLELRAPIFNGHRTRHQEEEADANLRSAKAREDDLSRQVVSEVQQALAAVRSSWEKIEATEIQVTEAESALSMANVRYEAGVVTNLDLLDAQTALSQAKLMHLRSLYDYTVSLTALDKATGKKLW
jgi:outer membrane protein TolC